MHAWASQVDQLPELFRLLGSILGGTDVIEGPLLIKSAS